MSTSGTMRVVGYSLLAGASRRGRIARPAITALLPRKSRQRFFTTEAAAPAGETYGSPVSTLPDAPSSRRDQVRNARPFSDFLTDTFDRQHDYLRISVTERCNLRCLYCMPEEGVPLSPNKELLTTPEIVLLSTIFVSQGVTKIRLTGGEPTVRRDILPLMHQIGALRSSGLKELCITTNGISLHRKLDSMIEAGLTGVNLSLDTLDPWQFQIMTRRKGFDAVQKSIDRILELNKLGAALKLKVNCVVMRGINDSQILPFVELTRDQDIEVRFIEYMPFDGNKWNRGKMLSYSEMLDLIKTRYPEIQRGKDHANDTSKTWHVPGFAGRIGFITSMTHNFCGTCNRLRITSDGNLKVCLFGNAEVSLRDLLRESNNGEPLGESALEAIRQVQMGRLGSMTPRQPTGIIPNEAELLDVIGMAVKRKKAKHAGIGALEHMKNRPMILIENLSASRTRTLLAKQWERIGKAISPRPWTGPHFGWALEQSRSFSRTRPRRQHDRGEKDGQDEAATKLERALAPNERLTHVSETGAARMVSIAEKSVTSRIAIAACTVRFSDGKAIRLILDNQMKKGDVLAVARVAGIMAAKRTPDLIPLCHPIAISQVKVDLEPVEDPASIGIRARVACDGKTGVEMEALTAASTAALTVYDMCKAVDKGMRIEGLRVVLKDGGKSGRWEAE
ncbi:hypothetical protein HIM_01781 [Hirsutella minnesotensis 3608]|nr:hypothetical protein HIM_01781 [Hirsutella minnesotensis 3608]